MRLQIGPSTPFPSPPSHYTHTLPSIQARVPPPKRQREPSTDASGTQRLGATKGPRLEEAEEDRGGSAMNTS